MIHGVLHLCGFNDKTKKEKTLIRYKENEALSAISWWSGL
jgi:ssRNA-specific RNase YbeY (16S rRNA maturation enzyme)